MKKIDLRFVIDEETQKIATAMRTKNLSEKNLSDLFEIVGILENLKQVILNKIKTFGEWDGKKKSH